MKRLLLALSLILGVIVYSNAQEEKVNHLHVKMELLKPFFWIERGYVIEPTISWHHKRLNVNASVGFSNININNLFEDQLPYNNKGTYAIGSIKYWAVKRKKRTAPLGLFFGLQFTYSSFDETGELSYDEVYFESYTAELKQANEIYALGMVVSYQGALSDQLIFDTGIIATTVLSDYSQPEFPVYYVPGVGIVNIFETRVVSQNENKFAPGLYFKLGYQIF